MSHHPKASPASAGNSPAETSIARLSIASASASLPRLARSSPRSVRACTSSRRSSFLSQAASTSMPSSSNEPKSMLVAIEPIAAPEQPIRGCIAAAGDRGVERVEAFTDIATAGPETPESGCQALFRTPDR